MILFNNNPAIISVTNIDVPNITREQFVDGLFEYWDKNGFTPYFHYSKQEMRDRMINNRDDLMITYDCLEHLVDIGYSLDIYATDVISMAEETGYTTFDNIIGFHTLPNGFQFWGVILSFDDFIDLFRIIYYDGQCFKFYTPSYGNTLNLNINTYMGEDEDEDDDYLSKYGTSWNVVRNANLNNLIDENYILQELSNVFIVGQPISGNISHNIASSNNLNNATNVTTSTQPQKTVMQIMYEIFSKKMFQMIPALQQSLVQKGLQSYDKSKCFKDLKNKDVFQNDIFNYILHFNNMDSITNKQIECTKIAIYIKKFRVYHEGEIIS